MINRLKGINEGNVIIILVTLVISFALPFDKISQQALNLAFFISFIYILIRKKKLNNKELLFPLFFILFGVFEFSWANLFHSIEYNYIHSEYIKSAKRLIPCSIILFHMLSIRDSISNNALETCGVILVLSCLYTSFESIYDYFNYYERVSFGIYATMGGYIYIVQSLVVLYVISTWKIRFSNVILFSLSLLILAVTMMTGTRVLIIAYPVCMFILFIKANMVNIKTIIAFCIVVLLGFSTNLIPSKIITERINNTFSEINRYKTGEVSTSLGARFSMWKAGIDIIKNNPYGLSADKRNELAKEYIINKQYSNPEALRAIESHLHNDILNIGSLQGWVGIFIFILLYILIIYFPFIITKSALVTSFVALPTVMFGLSDTLFIYSKYVYVSTCCLILYICFSVKSKKN